MLLRKDHRRPADSLPFEVEGDLGTIGNFDTRNSFVHPAVFTVEGHCPLTVPVPVPWPLTANVSFFLLGYSSYREVAIEGDRSGTNLLNLR